MATTPMYDYNVKDYGALGNFTMSGGKPATYAVDPSNASKNDVLAFQAAFDAAKAAGGGIVYVPAGYYPIKRQLIVYSNTKVIFHPNAHIIRNYAISTSFFTNGSATDGPYSGYNGHGDITFVGGTLHGFNAEPSIADSFNFFSFGHGHDITVKDMTMLDCATYHAIEINSSRTVRVLNCTFDGWVIATNFADKSRKSEAIQFDGMVSSAEFGAFGNYDHTTCEDILIEGNTIRNWCRGIGTHTGDGSYMHRDIKIIGNHFVDLTNEGIVTCMWHGTTIQGNTFRNLDKGIWMRVKDSTARVHDFSIVGNTFRNTYSHAIHIDGNLPTSETPTYQVEAISIVGNAIRISGQTAIYCENARRLTITANTIQSSSGGGIYLVSCNEGVVSNNDLYWLTGASGIYLGTSINFVISSNQINTIGEHGIYVSVSSSNNNISSNNIRATGTKAASTYNVIYVGGSSNYNLISNNSISSVTSPLNGIFITSTCSGNNVVGNRHTGYSLNDNGGSLLFGNG